ncbi:hypothetical protein [Streptomyces sp. ICBB 8177]|uniref:hypothetical protein n=1 Tax=Streptomyces sp. ICBB 8177 TaxID=563922 RepID=UPI000D67C8B8|nr:hypothetical protein [Streptomyces sp. ICBB 8177]PWI45853.1 hypothetical protein CK485_01460 [Streptomyces sp. ICBB 8177]
MFGLAVGTTSASAAPSDDAWGGVYVGGGIFGSNEWGQKVSGHAANLRDAASTSGRVVVTIPAGGKVLCWKSNCGYAPGGSYKCWSGGPSGNEWTAVNYKGKDLWVATRCVGVGQY